MQKLSNQCPVCLKILSSSRYLQKHLFMNKKKCVPPKGHIPPKIDYEKKIILWETLTTNKNEDVQTNQRPEGNVDVAPEKIHIAPEKNEHVISEENVHTTENEREMTNKYTIAVDSNGNIVDLPNIETQNDVVGNNPILMKHIKNIIKNLNIPNATNYKLPPEIEQFHKKIGEIVDQFGDIHHIIKTGLNNDLCTVETIISMNYDDENTVYIERINIPENIRIRCARPTTFIEILYSGMYWILTDLISHKSHFFEITHSTKAYNDRSIIMKYRKCVLISYLVLKYRLDKICIVQKSNPEHYSKLISINEKYVHLIDKKHLQNVHQYDEHFLTKLQFTCKLSIIELHSIIIFYEKFTKLINIDANGKFINPVCNKREDTITDDMDETEFKREPDCKYINLDNLPREHILFPDYDYEIINRDFCSHLVKIKPVTFSRPMTYDHPEYYYKRIYIDGSSAPPIDEHDYKMLQESY